MITSEQISTVLDHPVYDAERNKIGDVKHVFLDDATGQPEWVSVKTGMFGAHESFVPLVNASWVGDHLEVPYAKDLVKDAPNVDIDGGGHLSAQEEHRLYDYYSIDWDAGWQQANQPGEGGWAYADPANPMAAEQDSTAEPAMIRSEEHMHVGTERYETGRARLRKYVVTEEQEQTVPLRHEEVRVVREPITDTDRDATRPEIAEDEFELTLHEERPVVETRAEPVERVRLVAEEHTEQETVKGRVRKERIETELPDDNPR